MERIMKAQAFSDNKRQAYMMSKKTMEINPRHPIVSQLNKLVSAEEKDDEKISDLSWLLYDTASLSSGFQMEDATAFAARMYRLMKTGLNLSSLELEPGVE